MIYYLNLTNGLEFLNNINCDVDIRFIRISSSWLERKKFNEMLFSLGADFYLNLVCGNKVCVVDYSKNGMSRALWQGVEYIEYILNYFWLNKILCKDKSQYEFFSKKRCEMSKNLRKYIKYFKKFLNEEYYSNNVIEIDKLYGYTSNDGKYEYFKDLIYKKYI